MVLIEDSGFACSLCFRCLATLESTDLANTQAIKLSRVLIHDLKYRYVRSVSKDLRAEFIQISLEFS
ncbi:hypothetical protein NC653_014778 [Populus alba x Populus x berolinensis]|uniref:Uncharacterized protein n=1 Tax=Populus alba x Populus x berolinensis TaxID=444605 RepID=A0AAD6W4C0_9ROSI|nr:hypothetical protein NC653_014778 [Populus alba x Populus x berolinensis]